MLQAKTSTQCVATLPIRGMGDHQDVEITKTQSITAKMSDLRGYTLMPRLCSAQSVATPPVRGVGEHRDPAEERVNTKIMRLLVNLSYFSSVYCPSTS